MHSSDEDEDDFLSADEEGFGDGEAEPIEKSGSKSEINDVKQPKDKAILRKIEQGIPSAKLVEAVMKQDEEVEVIEEEEEKEAEKVAKNKSSDSEEVSSSETADAILKQSSNSVAEDEEDDEDEALADRIRERNLKIARKFSAEIAKSIKASAPVPVKPPALNVGFKVSDIEYPNISEHKGSKLSLPPAPPPTPALSSSFNNLDEQQSTNASSPTLNTTATATTQYGWRILPKIIPTPQASGSGAKETGATVIAQSSTSNTIEQTRSALDRLSENASHSEKNLFEKVAADLKKVSIRSEDPPVGQEDGGGLPNNPVPLIADLGSTLGSWGWSGATKLLSSASHVTSQVSSVLDSVVNVPSPQVPSQGTSNSTARDEQSQKVKEPGESSNENIPTSTSDRPTEDAFMGFTLNAMESIGKKAFNVMTERDKYGSLQLKGLGRPWEHLINLKKSYEQFELEDEETVDHKTEPDLLENTGTLIESKPRGDESPLPTSLKSRRRRRDNDDKLD